MLSRPEARSSGDQAALRAHFVQKVLLNAVPVVHSSDHWCGLPLLLGLATRRGTDPAVSCCCFRWCLSATAGSWRGGFFGIRGQLGGRFRLFRFEKRPGLFFDELRYSAGATDQISNRVEDFAHLFVALAGVCKNAKHLHDVFEADFGGCSCSFSFGCFCCINCTLDLDTKATTDAGVLVLWIMISISDAKSSLQLLGLGHLHVGGGKLVHGSAGGKRACFEDPLKGLLKDL